MRPNVPCSACDGSGFAPEWVKRDPSRRGGWTKKVSECRKCGGLKVMPAPRPEYGMLEVHSVKASKYSIDELLEILGVPDE